MFKKLLVILFLLPVFIFSQESGLASFPGLGFSINTFNIKEIPNNQPIISLYLPVTEKFAPNVSVLIQEFNGTQNQYKESSESQLKNENITTITSKIENDSYILEYISAYDDKKLHFYTIAKFKDGKVFLATAAATIKQWVKYKNELMSVINSLNLIK